MTVQNFVGQPHKPDIEGSLFASCGKKRTTALSQMVMGRRETDSCKITFMTYCQLPEGRKGIQLHPRLRQGGGKAGVIQQRVHSL